jgi:autotransporter-associated beta strand protein
MKQGGNIDLTSGNITSTGGGAFTIQALNANIASGTSTVSANLAGDLAAIAKTGAGRLVLSGTNSYAGVTTVSGGSLQFAKTASLYNSTTGSWTASNIVVGNGATLALNVGGTNEFTTGNVTTLLTNLGGLGGAVNNNGLKAGSAIAFDTTNASGGTFTVANNIANSTGTGGGAIGVTKLGTNALVLTGNNSYTGATTVSGGSLQLGNGGTTGSVANSANISVATGATLKTNRSDSMTLGQAITGAGNVEIANTSTGSTILGSNSNAYTGTTTVSGGSLQVGSSGTGKTGTGAVTVQTSGTILGTGVVQGSSFTAASGSTVQAGDSTAQNNYGTLTFTPVSGSGAFDFQSGSTTILGINPGGTSDLLNFVGTGTNTLLFNGGLSVTAPGYNPMSVETFNLLDWANLSTTTFHGRFSAGSYSGYLLGNGDDNLGFDLPDIFSSGYAWDISNFTTLGTISTVFVIPEPSRALLLMLGLVGLMTRRRRD